MEERGEVWYCSYGEERYPHRLKYFSDMPRKLFIRGDLPGEEKKTVAIVGARACSRYGAIQAYKFGKALAEAGVQVVSGLAKGIDEQAHRGALDGGGRTFGVLGSGINLCYPRQNEDLYHRMIWGQGGVLSEYPDKTPPRSFHFPVRNRIISGLADLLLVVEARERSGSLITAGYALEQGKPVYAVPGRLGDSLSMGCNRLIADGAGLADSAETLLSELKIQIPARKDFTSNSEIRLASLEEMVYSCLDLQPKSIEQIFQETRLELGRITEILLILELKGLIVEPVKNYYARAGG